MGVGTDRLPTVHEREGIPPSIHRADSPLDSLATSLLSPTTHSPTHPQHMHACNSPVSRAPGRT